MLFSSCFLFYTHTYIFKMKHTHTHARECERLPLFSHVWLKKRFAASAWVLVRMFSTSVYVCSCVCDCVPVFLFASKTEKCKQKNERFDERQTRCEPLLHFSALNNFSTLTFHQANAETCCRKKRLCVCLFILKAHKLWFKILAERRTNNERRSK